MVSEWEELEKLTKDELIIELVKRNWQMKNLKKVILDLADNMGGYSLFEPGQKPTDEWAEKIAKYAFRNGPDNLQDWGVDETTSNRLYDKYFDSKGDRRDL